MLPNLLINEMYYVTRNRKAKTLISSSVCDAEHVHPYHFTLDIDQWPSAAPGGQSGVGLDVHHGIVSFNLPCHGAHHAQRKRISKPLRTSQRGNQFSLSKIVSIGK